VAGAVLLLVGDKAVEVIKSSQKPTSLISTLRERIRVLFKLEQTPDDKHVKFLLSRLEKYKRTGYV